MTATGLTGQVRWVYLPALTFGAWRFEGTGVEGAITTSDILARDPHLLEQAPLSVVVPMGRHEWRWTVTGLQQSGETWTLYVSRQ